MMELSVIIPVYREEKNISKVIHTFQKKVHVSKEIVIVYDTKKDPTYSVVQNIRRKVSFPIKLVKNKFGNGCGVMNAIKTGIFSSKAETIVITMADLSDDISQIDTMFKLIKKGYDIVCASRYMPGGKKIGGPLLKTILSKAAGLSLFYLFNVPTHDSTNAFKMYKKSLFKEISIESDGGFEYSLEIILKSYKLGKRIIEIPTIWRDREDGVSNFKLLKWIPHYIRRYAEIFK